MALKSSERNVPTLQKRLSVALGLLGVVLLLVTMVSTFLIRNELFRQLELPLRRGPFPSSSSELRKVLIQSNEVCRFASFDNSTALNFWTESTQVRPTCPGQVVLKVDFTKFLETPVGSTGRAFQTTDSKGQPFRVAVARIDTDVFVAIGVSASGTLSTIRKLLVVQLAAIAVTLVALWFFGNWFTRRGLRSLEHIAMTANAIVAGDRSQRVVTDTQDPVEVLNVATALNEMLDDNDQAIQQRERSERKLRQFVSDASHELRTPLTSIQGYGELLETGVMSTPAQIVDVSQRVRSEANRMARLVDDMLQLANLDAEPHLNFAMPFTKSWPTF
jgi:two-component system, OmpR family, sensor kinase